MIRAVVMLVLAVLLTILLGIPALTLGMLVPARWFFEPLYYLWALCLLLVAGVRLKVQDPMPVDPQESCFFAGNHQSALDIPVLAVLTRGHVRFMAKESLFKIPLFGWCLRAHDFVCIDRLSARRAKRSIDAMLQSLDRRRVSMAVFPEGTRSPDGSVGPFRQGSMKVCQQAGLPLVPFAVEGSRKVHQRHVFRITPGEVRVAFGRPLAPEALRRLSTRDLSTQVRNEVVRMHRSLMPPASA